VTLVGFGVNMGLGTAEVVVLVRRLGCVNEIEIIPLLQLAEESV
jgi:hypothetical protein